MSALPPFVLVDSAPRPHVISRIADAVDLSIGELRGCGAKADRTASDGVMVVSDEPMHLDMLVVHRPTRPDGRIRIRNRVGDVSARIVFHPDDEVAAGALAPGSAGLEIEAAEAVMRLVSSVLRASADARTAYRPGTLRRARLLERAELRLRAVGTLLLSRSEGRDETLVSAPTPWSGLADASSGRVPGGAALWGRERDLVSLKAERTNEARSSWTLTLSPLTRNVRMDADPMEVLRILSTLPAARRPGVADGAFA